MSKDKAREIQDTLLELAGGDMNLIEKTIADVMRGRSDTTIDLKEVIKRLKETDNETE